MVETGTTPTPIEDFQGNLGDGLGKVANTAYFIPKRNIPSRGKLFARKH